jgi:hypothetical protein
MRARAPLASRSNGDEGRRARLSVDETGRKLRARPSKLARRSGERGSHAATSIRSNFALRLEHKLQTVVDGSAWRGRASLNCSRYRQSGPGSVSLSAHAPHDKCRLPYSLRVGVSSFRSVGPLLAPERSETVRSNPTFGWGHRGGRAGCPDGTQPEPLTVSPSFLRPPTWNWQAGLGDLPEGGAFAATVGASPVSSDIGA